MELELFITLNRNLFRRLCRVDAIGQKERRLRKIEFRIDGPVKVETSRVGALIPSEGH
jgi:hypothetical protein